MTNLLKPRYVLAVNDLQRSSQYYQEILGFKVIAQFDGWTFLSRDTVTLMIGECTEALPPSQLGDHSYFAYIEISDAFKLYAEFDSKGASFCKHILDEPWGMREFGVVTIDGHRVMFGQDC